MKNDLVGKRIQLVKCNDPFTRLIPGSLGKVRLVDSMGTVHVDWDNGTSLGLCHDDGDRWTIVG